MAATAVLRTELADAEASSCIPFEWAHADAFMALATIVRPLTGMRLASENAYDVPADWTNVIDAINKAGTTVSNYQAQLKTQADLYRTKINELQKELNILREKLLASDKLLVQLQEKGDACIAQAQAESEQRLQVLQSQMSDCVQAAEDRSRAAQDRAQTAEAWLQRIEAASQSLIPLETAHAIRPSGQFYFDIETSAAGPQAS